MSELIIKLERLARFLARRTLSTLSEVLEGRLFVQGEEKETIGSTCCLKNVEPPRRGKTKKRAFVSNMS